METIRKVKLTLTNGVVIEIECTPSEVRELLSHTHTLGRIETNNSLKSSTDDETESKIITDTFVIPSGNISYEEILDRARAISNDEIKDYILSLNRPKHKHSLYEIMMRFLGRVASSTTETNAYRCIFGKSRRARWIIEKKFGGKFKKTKEMEKNGKGQYRQVTVYTLEPDYN